jgi:hypothetical protein
VGGVRVATPHRAALKCLLGWRTLMKQKVSSLLQKPRFRLQYAIMGGIIAAHRERRRRHAHQT